MDKTKITLVVIIYFAFYFFYKKYKTAFTNYMENTNDEVKTKAAVSIQG
ncbi:MULTISPECIES: hypothetical protein [Heyndrickxia]|nr:hypothetical protein [Heyndrickxia shackletonii]NEY99730.1 hypothetical protein [Heyndrickxia shackletonii]